MQCGLFCFLGVSTQTDAGLILQWHLWSTLSTQCDLLSKYLGLHTAMNITTTSIVIIKLCTTCITLKNTPTILGSTEKSIITSVAFV